MQVCQQYQNQRWAHLEEGLRSGQARAASVWGKARGPSGGLLLYLQAVELFWPVPASIMLAGPEGAWDVLLGRVPPATPPAPKPAESERQLRHACLSPISKAPHTMRRYTDDSAQEKCGTQRLSAFRILTSALAHTADGIRIRRSCVRCLSTL